MPLVDHYRRLAMHLGLAAATLALLLLVPACKKDPEPPAGVAAEDPEAPRWIHQGSPHRKVAVVFVHGIFGGTTGTWTNGNRKTFFDLLKSAPDNLGDQVDIFAFGFASNMLTSGSLDIREASNKLDQSLIYAKVWDYDTVVLVAHSMGGLIAMRTLITHPERREKVPLLVLYATPQAGSQITSIAKVALPGNDAVRQMLLADKSEFLKDLDDTWYRIPANERPAVVCAYETMPTHGAWIVTQSSATRYCDREHIAIGNTDHISIVKPAFQSSEAVVTLVNALNKYVLGTPRDALLETPHFAPEGDHFVFTMTDPMVAPSTALLINKGAQRLHYTILPPSNPKLLIQPADTPRDLLAGQRETLQFDLLLRGQSDPEYRFTLKTSALPDRTIVVRVPDAAALQVRQAALMQGVGDGVSEFLSSTDNVARLKGLPLQQQREAIAAVARDAVTRITPGVSPGAGWVLAADALSTAGWPDLATTALRNAEQASPATAQSPSVQLLASIISAQSGEPVLRTVPQRDATPLELSRLKSNLLYIDHGNAGKWELLSARMQDVPALKQEGLVVEGDVLGQQGKLEAAKAVYIDADAVKVTPALQVRIEAVRKMLESPPR